MNLDISLVDSFAKFMSDGGSFMWLIMFCWILGIAIAFERYLKLVVYDCDGHSFMSEIQKYVIGDDVKGAIKMCSSKYAFIPKIFANGLKRSLQTMEQIQNAVDATALECISKAEKRFGYLHLLANLSTLIGLLGTIIGLIQSFEAVSAADPAQKAELLSRGISKAMNTTALGLISAITLMAITAILTSKQEKIVSEMDEYSIKLLDILGTKKYMADK